MHHFLLLFPHKKPICNRFFSRSLRLIGFPIATLLCCFPLSLQAEEANSEITLQQVIEKSLRQHPALSAYQYRLKSADAYAQHAAVGKKPQIHFTLEDAFGSGEYTSLDNAQSTLSISWILQGGLLEQRLKSEQSKINVVELERDIKRYDIAAQVTHTFLSLLAYQERLVVAKNAQQHASQILKEIKVRVDAGRSPIADKLQAEVNLERRELEIEDIQHELKSAQKILVSHWGSSEIDFEKASGTLMLSGELVDFNTLEAGINSNPEIQYFLTQQRVIDSEITLARQEAKNRWKFNAGVSRYEATEDYGVIFGVSLPLGSSSRNRHQIAALNAEQERYRVDARAKEIELSTKLYVLYEELKHSYHINESLTQKILPRLENALLETQKAYSLGKYSYREWYALQNEVLDMRMELINVRLQAYSNVTEIERLTGLQLTQSISTKSAVPNSNVKSMVFKNDEDNQ